MLNVVFLICSTFLLCSKEEEEEDSSSDISFSLSSEESEMEPEEEQIRYSKRLVSIHHYPWWLLWSYVRLLNPNLITESFMIRSIGYGQPDLSSMQRTGDDSYQVRGAQ